ncbi:hypothetical protein [Amycolatopsis sp. cmx-11-12]|uniref:hypothetical protein n=1 Tax=Amycolatopsis sp. cmx-11-12 TaxID=2785795 RepID=UPI003917E660
MATARHRFARCWFATLDGTDPGDSALEIVESLNDHELRPELAASYQRWLPLVNRFSFTRDG